MKSLATPDTGNGTVPFHCLPSHRSHLLCRGSQELMQSALLSDVEVVFLVSRVHVCVLELSHVVVPLIANAFRYLCVAFALKNTILLMIVVLSPCGICTEKHDFADACCCVLLRGHMRVLKKFTDDANICCSKEKRVNSWK